MMLASALLFLAIGLLVAIYGYAFYEPAGAIGFGYEWNAYTLSGILLMVIAALVGVASLPPNPVPLPEKQEAVVHDEFSTWLLEHKKTCKQCRESFDNEPGPICQEAFGKLQNILRAQKKHAP